MSETSEAIITLSGEITKLKEVNELQLKNLSEKIDNIHTPDDCPAVGRMEKEYDRQINRSRLTTYVLFGALSLLIALIGLILRIT